MSVVRELQSLINDVATPDIETLVNHLGEPCEVRHPVYPQQDTSSVFVNDKRFEDEIEYDPPLLATALVFPMDRGEPALVADQPIDDAFSIPRHDGEPLKGLITGQSVPERSAVTLLRPKPKHYYVLQRGLLNPTSPWIVQVYLIPMQVEDLSV